MPVTINDGEKHTGVSPKTVPSVTRNLPHFRESTRSQVLKTFEKLGFRPNVAALSLVAKCDLIGFVLWSTLNLVYTEMVLRFIAVIDAVLDAGLRGSADVVVMGFDDIACQMRRS